MIWCKEFFSGLEEKDIHMHIEMGDDGKYSVTRLGMITFEMEDGAPLTLNNVMYMPELENNLVSIAMLEDIGYDVILSKRKAFLRHIATNQVNKIRIRMKTLYKLEVDECVSLITKQKRV